MKRYLTVVLVLVSLLAPSGAHAQKKQLSQAREYIKAKKDMDKAETLMRDLLKDSVNRDNHRVWSVLVGALVAQYEQGNEQLYLKQKYDTAALFNVTKRLFEAMEGLDSVEMKPDRKGRVELRSREKNSAFLDAIRPNLFYGGTYFVNKKDYGQALAFFETYMGCASQPLLGAYDYAATDKRMPMAAYWAMYSGTKLGDADAVLRHATLARKDTTRLDFILQYMTEAYKLKGDRERYVETLKEGFERYPLFPFFFPRLIEYYQDNDDLDSAMAVADRALAADSADVFFLYAKSTVLLNSGRYEECAETCEKVIEKNDTLAGAYYNAGLAYFNRAVELDKVRQPSRAKRKQLMEYYRKSLPYMEKYRLLAPDQKEKWLSPLYTIYLNLNMGKEFDEIDKIKNEYRRNNK